MNLLLGARVAVRDLTRIPLSVPAPLAPADAILAPFFYAPVGLVIGLVLLLAGLALSSMEPTVRAALLVIVWVALTGARHLPALARVTGSWFRPHESDEVGKEREWIAGATAMVLALVLKYGSLVVVVGSVPGWTILLAAPFLARSAAAAAWLVVNREPSDNSKLRLWLLVSAIVTALVAALFLGAYALAALAGVILLVALANRLREGGAAETASGPAGAVIELSEIWVLLVAAAA